MHRFVVGFIAGFVLAAAGVAGAQAPLSWFKGNVLAGQSMDIQSGYAAGVSDAVQLVVVGMGQGVTLPDMRSRLQKALDCFDSHGQTLGALRDWARQSWAGRGEVAATLMLLACP